MVMLGPIGLMSQFTPYQMVKVPTEYASNKRWTPSIGVVSSEDQYSRYNYSSAGAQATATAVLPGLWRSFSLPHGFWQNCRYRRKVLLVGCKVTVTAKHDGLASPACIRTVLLRKDVRKSKIVCDAATYFEPYKVDPRDLQDEAVLLTQDLDYTDDVADEWNDGGQVSEKKPSKSFGQSGSYESLIMPAHPSRRRIYSTDFEKTSGLVGIPADKFASLARGTLKKGLPLRAVEDPRLELPIWRLEGIDHQSTGSIDTSWFGIPRPGSKTTLSSWRPSGASQDPTIGMFQVMPHRPLDSWNADGSSTDYVGAYSGFLLPVTPYWTGDTYTGAATGLSSHFEPAWIGSEAAFDSSNKPVKFTNPLGPHNGRLSWTYQLRHKHPVVTHFDFPEYQIAQRNTAPLAGGPGGQELARPVHELAYCPCYFSLEFGVPSTVWRQSTRFGSNSGDLGIFVDGTNRAAGTSIAAATSITLEQSGVNLPAGRTYHYGGFQMSRKIGTAWPDMNETLAELVSWAEHTAFDEYHLRGFMSYGGMPWLLPWYRGRIGHERVSDYGVIDAQFPGNMGHVARGFASDMWDYFIPRYTNGYDSSGNPKHPLPPSYYVGGHATTAYNAEFDQAYIHSATGSGTSSLSRVAVDGKHHRTFAADPTAEYLVYPQPYVLQPLVMTHAQAQGNIRTDFGGEFYPGSDEGQGNFVFGDEHADYETFLHMKRPSEKPRGLKDFKIKRIRDMTLPPRNDNNTGVSMKRRSWFWKINDVITWDNEEAWSLDKAYMIHTFGSSMLSSASVEVTWTFKDVHEDMWNSDEYVERPFEKTTFHPLE
jgi:hypothetical protein